jgi:hypothetical protein
VRLRVSPRFRYLSNHQTANEKGPTISPFDLLHDPAQKVDEELIEAEITAILQEPLVRHQEVIRTGSPLNLRCRYRQLVSQRKEAWRLRRASRTAGEH